MRLGATRYFQRLPGKIGLRRRERASEIGDRLALTMIQAGLDLQREDTPRPPVFDGLLSIPGAPARVADPAHDDEIMTPGDLSNKLLDFSVAIAIGQVELPHIVEIRER